MKTIVIGILVLFVLFLMMRGRTSGMVTRTPGPKKAPHAPWTLGPKKAPHAPWTLGPTRAPHAPWTPGPKKAPHAPWTLGPTRAPRTPGPTKSVFQKVVSILKPTMAPVKKK